MRRLRLFATIGVALVLSGCLRRAPTHFELDRRAGHAVPPAPAQHTPRQGPGDGFEEPLWAASVVAPSPEMPARIAPVIRRVWVHDQLLPDGSWLQGTWLFVEVEPARWLLDADPGAAPIVTPSEGSP